MKKWPYKQVIRKAQSGLIRTNSSTPSREAGGVTDKQRLFEIHYPVRTRHLYRALLRECTYLPDPASRTYISRYLHWRFTKARAIKPDFSTQAGIASVHARLKTAEKAVLYLRRANAGHLSHLSLILSMTYGRTRSRRHQLLNPLLVPSAHILETTSVDVIPTVIPQLHALIRSQSMRPEASADRGPIKRLLPKIPEKNGWGRPMPLKRVRNMKRKWWALVRTRVQPPLAREEWEHLKRLATGVEAWTGNIPRRPVGKSRDDLDVKISVTPRPEWQPHRVMNGISRPRILTRRTMRRLWAKVLVRCPTMEMVEGKWKVHWADAQSGQTVQPKQIAELPLALFDGVDERGKLMHPWAADAMSHQISPQPETAFSQ